MSLPRSRTDFSLDLSKCYQVCRISTHPSTPWPEHGHACPSFLPRNLSQFRRDCNRSPNMAGKLFRGEVPPRPKKAKFHLRVLAFMAGLVAVVNPRTDYARELFITEGFRVWTGPDESKIGTTLGFGPAGWLGRLLIRLMCPIRSLDWEND
jgi:hypothetical protein